MVSTVQALVRDTLSSTYDEHLLEAVCIITAWV